MAYAQAAHEIRQRIAAAPVEKWLKEEALADLDRLTNAAAADIKAVHEEYQKMNTELKSEDAEATGGRAEYRPSDFELRMIAVQNSGGHLSSVQHIYKFLKGELA